jgi:hypothetical protein
MEANSPPTTVALQRFEGASYHQLFALVLTD